MHPTLTSVHAGTYTEGGFSYTGDFHEDQIHGHGKFSYASGAHYQASGHVISRPFSAAHPTGCDSSHGLRPRGTSLAHSLQSTCAVICIYQSLFMLQHCTCCRVNGKPGSIKGKASTFGLMGGPMRVPGSTTRCTGQAASRTSTATGIWRFCAALPVPVLAAEWAAS